MISINLIMYNKDEDEMMHKLDMFEPYKHLGQNLCVDFDDTLIVNIETLTKIKENLEKSNKLVTAIWYAKEPQINIVNWNTKVVSTGIKWFMLHEYLKQFGIENPNPENNKINHETCS